MSNIFLTIKELRDMGVGGKSFIDNYPGQRFSFRNESMIIRIGPVPKGFVLPR